MRALVPESPLCFAKVAEPAGRKGDEADGGFLGSRVERFPVFPLHQCTGQAGWGEAARMISAVSR